MVVWKWRPLNHLSPRGMVGLFTLLVVCLGLFGFFVFSGVAHVLPP